MKWSVVLLTSRLLLLLLQWWISSTGEMWRPQAWCLVPPCCCSSHCRYAASLASAPTSAWLCCQSPSVSGYTKASCRPSRSLMKDIRSSESRRRVSSLQLGKQRENKTQKWWWSQCQIVMWPVFLAGSLRQYLDKDVALSEDAVHKYSDMALGKLNKIILELRHLFLVEDLVDSIKVRTRTDMTRVHRENTGSEMHNNKWGCRRKEEVVWLKCPDLSSCLNKTFLSVRASVLTLNGDLWPLTQVTEHCGCWCRSVTLRQRSQLCSCRPPVVTFDLQSKYRSERSEIWQLLAWIWSGYFYPLKKWRILPSENTILNLTLEKGSV